MGYNFVLTFPTFQIVGVKVSCDRILHGHENETKFVLWCSIMLMSICLFLIVTRHFNNAVLVCMFLSVVWIPIAIAYIIYQYCKAGYSSRSSSIGFLTSGYSSRSSSIGLSSGYSSRSSSIGLSSGYSSRSSSYART